MERTPDRDPTRQRRDRLLLVYGLGFLLLTNLLTVVFVFVFRGQPGVVVVVQPPGLAATGGAGSLAQPAAETRQVRVLSRPAGATVRSEGRVHGTTPVTVELPARATGVLELEKAGYRTRSVAVAPDRRRVSVRLTRVRSGARAPAARRDARTRPRDATRPPAAGPAQRAGSGPGAAGGAGAAGSPGAAKARTRAGRASGQADLPGAEPGAR